MATFSNLGLKLIAQGDEAGTWGTTTNTNLDIVDESFQYNSKNFTSDANLTITVANATTGSSGSPSGREQILEFTDTGTVLTASRNVIIQPSTLKKMWLFKNSTAQSLVLKMSNGDSGITIAAGKDALLYSTGAGVMKQSESASPGVTQVTGTANEIVTSATTGNVGLSLDNSIMRKIASGNAATGTVTNNFLNSTNYNKYKFTGALQMSINSAGNLTIQPITTGNATGVGNFLGSGMRTDLGSNSLTTAQLTNGVTNSWTVPLSGVGSSNQQDIWWEICMQRDPTYQSSNGNPYYGFGKIYSRSGLDADKSYVVEVSMGATNNGSWNTFGGLRFTTPANVISGHFLIEASD
tara:strand:- start:1498 stop:2553 length:1056 start_codon:yes stop_codon:yes gene_type:complete